MRGAATMVVARSATGIDGFFSLQLGAAASGRTQHREDAVRQRWAPPHPTDRKDYVPVQGALPARSPAGA